MDFFCLNFDFFFKYCTEVLFILIIAVFFFSFWHSLMFYTEGRSFACFTSVLTLGIWYLHLCYYTILSYCYLRMIHIPNFGVKVNYVK